MRPSNLLALAPLLLLLGHAPDARAQQGQAVDVATRDGSTLDGLLYRPAGDGPWPVIVVQTPYGKERTRPDAILGPEDREHYAFLVVDWRVGANVPRAGGGRGGGASDGRKQATDGHDVVEWAAGQPWSNGRIGTWGPSALGGVQYRTAEARPPHLDCIVPMVRGLQWTYDAFYPGGVERKEYVDALGALYGVDRLFRQHPTRDPFWTLLERAKKPQEIAVPALLVAGWFDLHPADMIASYQELVTRGDRAARAEHRLLIGPWEHMKVGKAEQGDLEFDDATILEDEVARWFDRWLRDVETPATAPIRYYVVGSGSWRETDAWPPAGLGQRTLHLGPDGALAARPAARPTKIAIPSRPDAPSPTIGGNNLDPRLAHGPKDQRPVESRDDVALFTSPPLAEPLTIVGRIEARIHLSTTADEADLHIRLTEVDRTGRSILIADGARRASHPETGRRAQPLAEGEVRELVVRTEPTAWRVPAGHRLRLVVSASNHPRYASDPETEGVHTLHLGDGDTAGGRLVLPVAPGR